MPIPLSLLFLLLYLPHSHSQQTTPCPVILPIPKNTSRIVNGQPLEPSQQSLFTTAVTITTSQSRCSGTLLTSTHVLTAAHCDPRPGVSYVRIPGANLSTVGVRQVFRHGSFKGVDGGLGEGRGVGEGDLCVVELVDVVEVNGVVVGDVDDGKDWGVKGGGVGRLVGGGEVYEGGGLSEGVEGFRFVDLPRIGLEECSRMYGGDSGEGVGKVLGTGEGSYVCAGYKQGLCGSCLADSGGGFFVEGKEKEELVLVGVVLGSEGCARQGKPVILTRLGGYLEWMKNVVGKDLKLVGDQRDEVVGDKGSGEGAIRGVGNVIWWHGLIGVLLTLVILIMVTYVTYFIASRVIRRNKISKRMGNNENYGVMGGYDPLASDIGSSRRDSGTGQRRRSSRLTRTSGEESLGPDSLLSRDEAHAAALAEALAAERRTWKNKIRRMLGKGDATDSDSEYVSQAELEEQRRIAAGLHNAEDVQFMEDHQRTRDSYVQGITGATVIDSIAAGSSVDGDSQISGQAYDADSFGRERAGQTTMLRDSARDARRTRDAPARKDSSSEAARILQAITDFRENERTNEEPKMSTNVQNRSPRGREDSSSTQSRQSRHNGIEETTANMLGSNIANGERVTSPSGGTRSSVRDGEEDNGRSTSHDTGQTSFKTAQTHFTGLDPDYPIPVEKVIERHVINPPRDRNYVPTPTVEETQAQRDDESFGFTESEGESLGESRSEGWRPLKKSGLEMWEFGLGSAANTSNFRRNGANE